MIVKRQAIPPNSKLETTCQKFDYSDCFQGVLTEKESPATPTHVCIAFLASVREVLQKLLRLKATVLSLTGRKSPEQTSNMQELNRFNYETGEQLGLLKVFYRDETEIILGADTKRLNFRISLLMENVPSIQQRALTFTTGVVRNDYLGKITFFLIKPLHRALARHLLKSAIKKIENRNGLGYVQTTNER